VCVGIHMLAGGVFLPLHANMYACKLHTEDYYDLSVFDDSTKYNNAPHDYLVKCLGYPRMNRGADRIQDDFKNTVCVHACPCVEGFHEVLCAPATPSFVVADSC